MQACPADADNRFGPRVDPACRSFDFTLLFQDAFFTALPAAVFLLLVAVQLWRVVKTSVKADSYILATWKLSLLAVLFTSHLASVVLLSQTRLLITSLSLAAGVLATVAVTAALILSFLKDQRSARPSDLLVFYFSTCVILAVPRLRTIWLLPKQHALKAVLTINLAATIAVVVAESIRKIKFLRPPYRKLPIEETVSFWIRGLFVWVLPFFRLGYGKQLVLDDIPAVGVALQSEASLARLEQAWRRRQSASRHRLLRATLRANRLPLLFGVIPRLTLMCFSLVQPFLISTSVENLQTGDAENRARYGRALVGAFVLTYTGKAVSRALYQRQTYRMSASIRASLISKVYHDTTTFRLADVKDAAAVTLMGTDVERIHESAMGVHEVWASIIEIIIAVWLLVRQVSYAAILPLVVCLVSMGGASQIGNHFGPAMASWIERVQKRVAVTARFINDIKAVKMLGLSEALYRITTKLRQDELHASGKFRRLLVLQILTGNIPTLLAPFSTFIVYAIIARVRNDQALLATQAFTSLSLISLITEPLLLLCEAWPRMMQAVACFQRIQDYSVKAKKNENMSDDSEPQTSSDDGVEMHGKAATSDSTGALVSFQNVHVAWSTSEDKNVLHALNLKIHPGFTAVIGAVASGKSTLLASIIGETIISQGSVSKKPSRLALCSQNPFIVDDTVRYNIVGDEEFDEEWYDFAVTICCLKKDLMNLPLGDGFRCGSKGSALSGGQRQRVALARAVFSKLTLVILDDIMSGFDPRTMSNILANLFGETGYFRTAGISVIMATHNQRILPYMDAVVVLENGRITEADSYEHIKLRSPTLVKTATVVDEAEEEEAETSDAVANATTEEDDETALERDSLRRRTGSWSVYSYYCKSAGTVALLLWAVCTFSGAVLGNYTAIWIRQWTDVNEKHPNQQTGLYLGVYALLVVLSIAGTAGECWIFFVNIINDTALKLHDDLLRATVAAPYHFFYSTDTGSITNRFSQDMDLIDMTLPANAITFTTAAASCLVQLVIICVVGKYLAAAIPALVFVLFAVQRSYLRTSRQLRLMDIEAKAPIYKLFLETIEGNATIRALGWGTAFQKRQHAAVNASQKAMYMLASIQQWLALVLDLIVGGMAVVIIASATAATTSITAGDLGVALVMVIQFSSMLTQCIQSWTRLETSIGAVARVQDFIKETPSEPTGTLTLQKGFPEQGTIGCEALTASYSPESDPVLNNIDLRFAAGEKIALCGPSGSGKSSLIMSILSMMGFTQGRVTIDNVDTSGIAGSDLRERLNVVPQEPFFLPGTVRINMDPRGISSDDAIEVAMRRVGLWDKMDGLDADLDATALSVGEQQMLCLTRAMLVPGKVLILDEAMSSVDEKTEADMQAIIDTEFQEQTVISVVHRFDHIHSYNRVVLMRNGEVVEHGAPQDLLAKESAFRSLYDAQKG